MKFLMDEEPEIIEAVTPSSDKGFVILPTDPNKMPQYSELEKELTAIDVIDGMKPKDAAMVHRPGERSAARYANGENMDADTRARVLDHKYEIQDVAITKLMDTLNLLDPNKVDKQRDLIAIASGLSQVVEKVSDKGTGGVNQVHLHLYSPNQKKETDYKVIEA